MSKKKATHWGITEKVFAIAAVMFMTFFLIVMIFQFLISGYEIIHSTEESLSSRLSKANTLIETFDFTQMQPYNYEVKQLLANLRRSVSDENTVCEFLITDRDGNIICALHNEVVVLAYRGRYIKYAYFDDVPIGDLYQAVLGLQEPVNASSLRPEVLFKGVRLLESYAGDTYYAYQCYQIECNDVTYLDLLTQTEKTYSENTVFMDFGGKYYDEFVTGSVSSLRYTELVNQNREALIADISAGTMVQRSDLLETVYYRTLHVGQDYQVVMRLQVNPLEAVFWNAQGTYLALAILAIAFATWLAVIFSRMIVRPVRRIDEKAKKLAVLDFSSSHSYNYNRQDEIGSLYYSVNTLAVNLDRAIAELQEKNRQLSNDIELERQMDAKRREFTAATSHELKTPLARIRGYAEALQLNLSEEKKNQYCSSLMKEVDLMNGLILEMLSLSKLEAQHYEDLNLETLDLLAITETVIARFAKQIQDKHLDLRLVCLQMDVFAKGDRAKIERVITNFVDNAVHYTPEGKQIEIFIEEQEKRILFEIENEGSHIEEESLPYIWDSFYKEDKARTKTEKSVTADRTGLGLSIVRAILNLHQVDFGVKNTDAGVKFYFYLEKG